MAHTKVLVRSMHLHGLLEITFLSWDPAKKKMRALPISLAPAEYLVSFGPCLELQSYRPSGPKEREPRLPNKPQ